MTLDEIKMEIKILSNNTHGDYSLDIEELRVQLSKYVYKSLRRVSGAGKPRQLNYRFP